VQPKDLVDLLGRQLAIGGRHGAQHLGVELDLLERYRVVEPEVNVVSHVRTSPVPS
jgi:hypothetical protein